MNDSYNVSISDRQDLIRTSFTILVRQNCVLEAVKNGGHFAYNIIKSIFLNENIGNSI